MKQKKPIGSFGSLGTREIEKSVSELAGEAKRKAARWTEADEAMPMADMLEKFRPSMAREAISGWLVILSLRIRPNGEWLWHGSASLHPLGRSSTVEDWKVLGMIVAASGAPEGTMEKVANQISEGVDPNAPHHWIWKAAAP